MQIELGLQTSNEQSGRLINRCYTNEDYIAAVARIHKTAPDIHIVTHLIFGLPGETEEDMLNSVRFVTSVSLLGAARQSPFGIKITSLYILKNTSLDYFRLLEKALPLLPENCIIHRLTGDPPKAQLIAPAWTTDKKRVLNDLLTLVQSHNKI